jgi:hypothetical protein
MARSAGLWSPRSLIEKMTDKRPTYAELIVMVSAPRLPFLHFGTGQ